MNLVDLRSQLELDLTWRAQELAFLQNQIATLEKPEDQNMFRRSAVMMLYAHFEGFTKTALSIYASALNAESVPIGDAHEAIAALSLTDALHAMCNPTGKSSLFKRALPNDSELHRFARHREFVAAWHEIRTNTIAFPVDDVVETESNLRPVVLRKCLYRLGLDIAVVDAHESTINELLNRRNSVAHGASKSGVEEHTYAKLKRSVTELMEAILSAIMNAVEKKHYLATV